MPPPSIKKSKQDNQPKPVRFRLDGKEYTVDPAGFGPRIERELFIQAGMTVKQLGDAMAGAASFAVPALVFLARRQAGEMVQYQPIEDALWAAQQAGDVEIEFLDGEVDAGPPAQGGS